MMIHRHANQFPFVSRVLKQVAALPFSIASDGEISMWLVTTRNGRHWIIPKGNVDEGWTPHTAAAQEALEEAGLIGDIEPQCLGSFAYRKQRAEGAVFKDVDVYGLRVGRQLKDWPEKGEREVLRCSVATALSLITVPGLAQVIEDFFNRRLRNSDGPVGVSDAAFDQT